MAENSVAGGKSVAAKEWLLAAAAEAAAITSPIAVSAAQADILVLTNQNAAQECQQANG